MPRQGSAASSTQCAQCSVHMRRQQPTHPKYRIIQGPRQNNADRLRSGQRAPTCDNPLGGTALVQGTAEAAAETAERSRPLPIPDSFEPCSPRIAHPSSAPQAPHPRPRPLALLRRLQRTNLRAQSRHTHRPGPPSSSAGSAMSAPSASSTSGFDEAKYSLWWSQRGRSDSAAGTGVGFWPSGSAGKSCMAQHMRPLDSAT